MPVLIHLNGPSGVGKSTVAELYVSRHAGVLNLDIDRVVAMIGGWQDDFFGTLAPARRIALAMAEAHLAAGADVVMPQLVSDLDEASRFEEAAARAGADYLEIALVVDAAEQVRRFRDKPRRHSVDTQVRDHIQARGGDALLRRIHRHFTAYLAERPRARRLAVDGQPPERTCRAVIATVAG